MEERTEDERFRLGLQSLLLRPDALETAEPWLWQELVSGARDRSHPWFLASLSTVAKDECGDLVPSSRTVVLRGADTVTRTLDFYTDYRSSKMCSLLSEGLSGSVCWLFYRHGTQGQLRVDARYEVLRGEAIDSHWCDTPEASKGLYATIDPPGATLQDVSGGRADADLANARENFCVVRTFVKRMDLVWLDSSGNRRLQVDYTADASDGSVGWLVP